MKLKDMEQLKATLAQYEDVIVYGAGRIGSALIQKAQLCDFDQNILCVAVRDLVNNPISMGGIPVCNISDLTDYKEKGLVLIATLENIQEQIESGLRDDGFCNVVGISNVLAAQLLKHDPKTRFTTEQQIPQISRQISELGQRVDSCQRKLNDLELGVLRTTVLPRLPYLVLNILDNCNLRCIGCDHFACIAEPNLIPAEVVKKDLTRMSEILEGELTWMGVMGGEPLLHPELNEILEHARKCFPDTTIRLTTNGLLLMNMKDDFWDTCHRNNITIVCTKYNINLKYDAIQDRAKEHEVIFQYFEGTGDGILKYSYKKTLDLTGSQDPAYSYRKCDIANYGNTLCQGRLYGCPLMQASRIFNKKFNQNLKMDKGDSLDIYKVESKKEILEFSARAKGFCRYCNVDARVYNIPWQRSKQEITEWI